MSIEHNPIRHSGVERYLRPREICEKLGISRATYWRWVKSGRLPPPVPLGKQVRGTPESDLAGALQKLST